MQVELANELNPSDDGCEVVVTMSNELESSFQDDDVVVSTSHDDESPSPHPRLAYRVPQRNRDDDSDDDLDRAHDAARALPSVLSQDEETRSEYDQMVKLGLPVMFFNNPKDAFNVSFVWRLDNVSLLILGCLNK